MLDGLAFGWRTATLTVAVVQLLILAAALTRPLANRVANRTLAALLVVLVGVVTPWLIGFAGFYDRWRWLTFAPFANPLAVAPLLYLYVHALVAGAWPARGWRHFIPAAAAFVFLTASFLLPLPQKLAWSHRIYDAYGTLGWAGTAVGLAAYGALCLRLLRGYRALLSQQRSDDARFAARWLSRAVAAMLVLLPVWAGYTLWDWVAPLGYTGLMGLHLAVAAVALFLGIEGWRHAHLPFPPIAALAPPPPEPTPVRDWRATGERWAAEVRAGGWAADPELSLPILARRLGTNTNHLSRALNEGMGTSFSTFVNGLRCEAVAAAIRANPCADLLGLAFEAGFASKASFNRAFVSRYGKPPSAWRRDVSNRE